jgi:hypothetical protein
VIPNASIIEVGDQQVVTLIVPGDPESPYVASTASHGSIQEIVDAVRDYDPSNPFEIGLDEYLPEILPLFSPEGMLNKVVSNTNLSSRVRVENGEVLLDDEPVNSTLADLILRLLGEGGEGVRAWVRFLERIEANPNEHSRTMLFDWLRSMGDQLSVTPDGLMRGFKGVTRDADGTPVSITHGPAIVDGKEVDGAVPNYIGATVEMQRNQVEHDPARGCSVGLHVGTFSYAKSFSRGLVLECHVDPADVVSVPTDCNWAKVRTSRYVVVGEVEVPDTNPLAARFEGLDDDGEADFEGWGFGDEVDD